MLNIVTRFSSRRGPALAKLPSRRGPSASLTDRSAISASRCRPYGLLCAALLFAVPAAQAQFTNLHNFVGQTNGASPSSNVLFDSSGDKFGLASSGGPHGGGIIWEIDASGTFHDLYNFGGSSITNADGSTGADGSSPTGTISLDSSNNLYGVCSASGPNSGGNLWSFNITTKLYSDLHDFGAGSDGAAPQGGATLDSSNNVYGTTQNGGTHNAGILWEYSTTAGYSVVHNFGQSNTDGSSPLGPACFDASGNMWGTCSLGGRYGFGTVWRISSTSGYQTLYSFVGYSTFPVDGGQPHSGVAFDSVGNAYGTCSQEGRNFVGTLWEITTSNTYVDLYDFKNSDYPVNEPIVLPGNRLIGVTPSGGASHDGELYSYTPATGLTTVYSFTGNGYQPQNPLTLGSDGDVYGVCLGGGNVSGATGIVFKYAVPPLPVSISTSRGSAPALAGGVGVTFTVTVTTPASFPGGAVTLTSADPSHILVAAAGSSDNPATSDSVTVAAGSNPATFNITAPSDVTADKAVVLTASAPSTTSATTTVTVKPFVQRLTMSAAGTLSGRTLSGYAYVYEAPPTDQPLFIATTLADANLQGGPIMIPAGQAYSNRITFLMNDIDATENGTISTWLDGGVSLASTNASIYAPWLTALSFNPTSVNAGGTSTLTATVNAAFASDHTFNLTSNKPGIATSTQITIPAGQTTGTATVQTANFAGLSKMEVTFTGSLGTAITGTATHIADLVVTPYQISSISFPTATNTGSAASGTITLTSPAVANGQDGNGNPILSINLTSSNPSLVPNCTVSVPAGQTSAAISVPTTFTWGTAQPTITLSGTLDGTLTRTGTMKLVEESVIGVSVGQSDISELDTTSLNVTLAYAPAADQSVSVTSSNAREFGTATVPITGGQAVGSANITPTFNALATAETVTLRPADGKVTTTVTVHPEILSISLNPPSVNGSAGTTATITLYEAYTGSQTAMATSTSSAAGTPSTPISLNGGTTITFPVTTTKRTTTAVAYIALQALGYKLQSKLTINPGP